MKIRVGVAGYDLIGKRVAAAVVLQSDMTLEGVYEDDPLRRPVVQANGYRVWDDTRGALAASCDVVVDFCGVAVAGPISTVCGPQAACQGGVIFSLLAAPASVFGAKVVKLPSADAVALARAVRALAGLGKIERLFSAVITRSGHATSRTGGVDALEPIFDGSEDRRELPTVLSPLVGDVQVRRVRAPYTHSHLHMLTLDFDRPVERDGVLEAMAGGPRILLAPSGSGFANTAQLQEFFRDLGGSRADRAETFIWEETVLVHGCRVSWIMDVEPEATLTAECIDAIRLNQVEHLGMSDSVAQTDRALGIGRAVERIVP